MMTTVADAIARWLHQKVDGAGANGIVLGLSGGIDSAVVAGVAVRAFGPDRVTAVIMPAYSLQADVDDARLVADHLGIEPLLVDLSRPFDALVDVLPDGDQLAVANIKPRLRMITLYHIANTDGLMVVGTGNRTELMVGYFTKYGDGGVDLLPLGSLYKHEVRDLARAIEIPERIVERPPSAGLWAGQTDEEEMGITYEELDGILAGLEQGNTSGFPAERVNQVRQMVERSAHKRSTAPICELSRPLSMLEMA